MPISFQPNAARPTGLDGPAALRPGQMPDQAASMGRTVAQASIGQMHTVDSHPRAAAGDRPAALFARAADLRQDVLTQLAQPESPARTANLARMANTLMGQASAAREAVALMHGVDPKKLPPTFAQDSARANELNMGSLSATNMEQATQLLNLANANLQVLGKLADSANVQGSSPKVELYSRRANQPAAEESAKTIKAKVLAGLKALMPAALLGNALGMTAKGADLSHGADRLTWAFRQHLRNNPDVMVAIGAQNLLKNEPEKIEPELSLGDKFVVWAKGMVGIRPPANEPILDQLVLGMNVSPGDRQSLKARLETICNEELPNHDNVILSQELARGANGVVYEGQFGGREVVVKCVIQKALTQEEINQGADYIDYALSKNREDALESSSKILHEVTVQASLNGHAHLPKALGVYKSDDGLVNLVMERAGNKSLDKLTQDLVLNPNGPKIALHLFSGMVKGVAALHDAGMVHVDIKPENAVLDGRSLQARLIDFGSGGRVDGMLSRAGSPAFFSPEHVDDSVDYHMGSDVFSLGSSLYAMIAGDNRLFTGARSAKNPVFAIGDTLNDGGNPGDFSESVWNGENMQPVKNLIQACWATRPEDRPTTAQMTQALNGDNVQNENAVLSFLRPGQPLMTGALELIAAQLGGA